MGQINKLFLPFQGQPLLRHSYQQLQAANIQELIVVSGHESDRVEALIPEARWVHNTYHLTGMTSSIQAGVIAASPQASGFLIALSDMPFLSTADYNQIIQAFTQAANNHSLILQPQVGGQRGNPVLFGADYKTAILNHQVPTGCKAIIKAHQNKLHLVKLVNTNVFMDIDTPNDFENIISNNT